MNISRLFIQRPVATALVMLAIVLAGLVGLRFLPVAALPQGAVRDELTRFADELAVRDA